MQQKHASEKLCDKLLMHHIGFGLVCIASPHNNDLNKGLTFVHQALNPHPIDPVTMNKIRADCMAHGLMNREYKYVIQMIIKRSLITGSIVEELKGSDYTNLVKWSDDTPQNKCIVANGNHHMSYMEERYEKEIFKLKETEGMKRLGKGTPCELKEWDTHITALGGILKKEAVWLVAFYDQGKGTVWHSIHAC